MGDGSVLALLIPWKQMTWRTCNVLAANYKDVQVFRFPDVSGPGLRSLAGRAMGAAGAGLQASSRGSARGATARGQAKELEG